MLALFPRAESSCLDNPRTLAGMRPVLATQFSITPPDGTTERSAARDIARAALDWCAGWYARKLSSPAQLPAVDGGRTGPMDGHVVEAIAGSEDPSGGEWELRWSYPSDVDSSALWTTEIRLLWDGEGVEVSIVLSIGSTDFAVRPFSYDVFPPRLVRTLVDSHACELGGRPLRSTAQQVTLSNVAGFVSEHLCDDRRRLPILLVSRERHSNLFLADPTDLARELCGLAEVWAINDKWTSYALSDALGARLSCFDGAVRTYWPGFTLTSDPFQHPIILPAKLRALEAQGGTVGRFLVRHLAPVSALRFTESERLRRRRLAEAEATRNAAEDRAREIAHSANVGEIEAQLLESYHARYQLEAALAEADARVQELQGELAAVKQNFALVASATHETTVDAAGELEENEPTTVLEALETAYAAFPVLSFWDSARASAAESHFARPDHVLRALSALAEVAELYFQQRRSRKPLGNLEDRFEERGFKYAASDSQTTITKYGVDRTFRKKLFERHLTLGGGDRQNCLQIYFDFDMTKDAVHVAYCGMHLPYEGMRS